jgi:two-component system, HptB-dependent secretion and biofilm response regulator
MALSARMKILVVDDADSVLLLVSRFIEALGHMALQAHNGEEAVALWRRERPDLILMDVMMPVMSGPEAAEIIKRESGESWVPVVFITSVGEEAALADALERCADDYLTKPVNFRVLEAKLKALARTLELTRKVREQSLTLGAYYERTEEERRVVRHLMEQMVNADRLADPCLQYWLSPAESLSGDLIACARTPGGALHVLLADGIGHGITAALNVLPLTQPFYSMSDKGYCISDILQEMNNKVRQVLPVGRFVAVALVAIDEVARKIEIWNSGMPAVHVFDDSCSVMHVSKSSSLPLGILPNEKMDFATDILFFDRPGFVLAHSDGLTEAFRTDREVFGLSRVLDVLADAPQAERLSRLQADFSTFMAGSLPHDDVSLALASFCVPHECASESSPAVVIEAAIGDRQVAWQYGLRLGAAELKSFRTVPFLMSFVNGIQSLRSCRSDVYRILQALADGAVQQGVLGLPSCGESSSEAQGRYQAGLQQALEALQSGWLELQLSWYPDQERPVLLIRAAWFCAEGGLSSPLHLPVVRALCAEVRYDSLSNEVLACYIPASL